MNGVQCDNENCKRFAAVPPAPEGWFIVLRQGAPVPHPMAVILGGGPHQDAELPYTFCSLLCLVDWAYPRLVIDGPPGGAEPGTRR